MFGKSEQATTTGAQLFNAREALKSQIEKGVVSFDSEGKIILNGTFHSSNRQFSITFQPGTYTLSGDDNGVWHILAPIDSVFRQKLVVDVETTYNCYIASNTYNNHVTAPMINIGETAKPYEPYTGGKQSPSPEYPQEIVSKKISEINIKKSLNLFDKSKLVKLKTIDTNGDIVNNGSSHVSGYIPVKPNTTYSMTGTNQTRGKFYQSDKKGIGTDYNFNPSKDTSFKTDENTHFIQFCLGTSNDGSNVMLNEGNTLLPYMDYAEEHQKITLSNSNVLLGIPVSDDGNITIDGRQYVSDVIKEKDGVIGIERNVKVVNAKDLTWRKDFYTITALDKYIYRFSCIDVEDIKLRCGMLSNRLSYNSSGVKDFGQISCEEKNKIRIAISESCNTLELFNKFLQDNEIIIYYQLDVPTFEPLPKVDQDAIKKLHTYYPNTTINTGAWTEVEYIADTKLYIDKKFEELSQAIVNTQIALL